MLSFGHQGSSASYIKAMIKKPLTTSAELNGPCRTELLDSRSPRPTILTQEPTELGMDDQLLLIVSASPSLRVGASPKILALSRHAS